MSREYWLDSAYFLAVLRQDEAIKFNELQQKVSEKKLAILKGQEGKKNVSLAEAETRASNEYREMKNQEDKIYSIDEIVRVAKRNSDINL